MILSPTLPKRWRDLIGKKLRFFRRERPRGIKRQAIRSHAMHAKDPGAGEEGDDVDAYSRHVAIVVRDRLLRERRARRCASRTRGVTNELGDHALARCA